MAPPRTVPKRARRLCAFQMHWTDADDRLFEANAVVRARQSGLFDEVVLAVADVPENRVLERFADRWGVEIFYGAERDVAARLRACAERYSCDVISRSLVWWFFQDLTLVERQLSELEASGADYVDLPTDFDIRFGADVFHRRLLERATAAFDAEPALRTRHGLNPWSWVEAQRGSVDVRTVSRVPVLDRAAFDALRERMRGFWPERWDGAGSSLEPYRVARELLEERGGGSALDLACGMGVGTRLLSDAGPALGVDLCGRTIARAKERHGESERLRFLAADAFALDLPAASFDLVVSVHTLEHVADEQGFLERVARWLAPDGWLLLEVPFLARDPFREVDTPLSPGHVREYDARSLAGTLAAAFDVVEAWG